MDAERAILICICLLDAVTLIMQGKYCPTPSVSTSSNYVALPLRLDSLVRDLSYSYYCACCR